jgi:hypothetical protein
MSTNTKDKPEMDTKSSDVSTGLSTNPENSSEFLGIIVEKLLLIDSSNTELTLDRGNEWRSLEEGSSQSIKSLLNVGLASRVGVETNNSDVLLTGTLLSLHQSSSSIQTN